MPLAVLDAFIAGDLPRARGLTDYSVPDEFPGQVLKVLELRRMQLAADPALAPWSARAMVRREDRVRRSISSTTPNNAPSLRVHDKLGFRRTGQVVDGEIIFELHS